MQKRTKIYYRVRLFPRAKVRHRESDVGQHLTGIELVSKARWSGVCRGSSLSNSTPFYKFLDDSRRIKMSVKRYLTPEQLVGFENYKVRVGFGCDFKKMNISLTRGHEL